MRGGYSSKYSNFLLLTIVLFNLLCAVGPPGLPIGQKAEASKKEFYKILSQNHTKQRREPQGAHYELTYIVNYREHNSCLREMIVEIEEQTGNIVSLKNGKEICESTLPHFRVCAPLKCVSLNFPFQPEKVVAIFQCQLDSFCIKLRVSERISYEQSAIFFLQIFPYWTKFPNHSIYLKVFSTEVPSIAVFFEVIEAPIRRLMVQKLGT